MSAVWQSPGAHTAILTRHALLQADQCQTVPGRTELGHHRRCEFAGEAEPLPEPAGPQTLLLPLPAEKLRDHFSKYGSIVEAVSAGPAIRQDRPVRQPQRANWASVALQVVMRDRQTGRPRGFGFVTFTEPAAADAVVEDVHVIDGRQVRRRGPSRAPRNASLSQFELWQCWGVALVGPPAAALLPWCRLMPRSRCRRR